MDNANGGNTYQDYLEVPPHLFFILDSAGSPFRWGSFLIKHLTTERRKLSMKTNLSTKKIALAGVFTALAVVGSFISFPVAGSKCAPGTAYGQHSGCCHLRPLLGIGIAFIASLLRNLLALGSLMAFPGSMVGALCCGLVYHSPVN